MARPKNRSHSEMQISIVPLASRPDMQNEVLPIIELNPPVSTRPQPQSDNFGSPVLWSTPALARSWRRERWCASICIFEEQVGQVLAELRSQPVVPHLRQDGLPQVGPEQIGVLIYPLDVPDQHVRRLEVVRTDQCCGVEVRQRLVGNAACRLQRFCWISPIDRNTTAGKCMQELLRAIPWLRCVLEANIKAMGPQESQLVGYGPADIVQALTTT
eukprot:CAMPEP_0177255798 /NCGR_PEP_ID=MMETSP0367-20130122/56569_1 /TAXON_ID=447022 ORGANISM="Scrippsiella hangoei-like, Strain SHHI-4" /NCGR_SAMPLE_ID=MMETSP0367 /ASSEMBLY_ACC=CAM_ASM_000362 /LENGTH=214 /DNA_ID=CAMNT_0018709577 /DNA_START=145 /DNA_END=789 /DNA_ORIENTATION=+